MRKKLVSLLLVTAATVSMFVACGEKTGSSAVPTEAPKVTVAPTEVPGNKYVISDDIISGVAAPTAPDGVEVTAEMQEKSIVCPGNADRLAGVMERAAKGEEITIAYIGGSITNGSSATPQAEKCYANLTTEWWKSTFKNAKINYVNAGIGATDSYLGVHRVDVDVLSKDPDLVIVEFSVNDTRGLNQETYESLIRKILSYKTNPAVVSLVLCTETSYYKDHYQIAYKLQVPCISYAKIVQENMKAGTWAWDQLGSSDKTHPINGGHSVIANLLTSFFEKTLKEINNTNYTPYEIPADAVTLNRYENAKLLFSDQIEATEMDGFEKATVKSNMFNNNGWTTETAGTISFDVKAECLGIIFWGTKDGKSGQFDVYVNDEYQITIDADFKNKWGSYADYVEVGRFSGSDDLKVTIKPKDGSTGDKLSIIALAVS